jgi:hypothetical protein
LVCAVSVVAAVVGIASFGQLEPCVEGILKFVESRQLAAAVFVVAAVAAVEAAAVAAAGDR